MKNRYEKKIVGQGFILAKFGSRRLQPAQIIVVSRKKVGKVVRGKNFDFFLLPINYLLSTLYFCGIYSCSFVANFQ